MAEQRMRCVYHVGIGTTYEVRDHYIYGQTHRVALCKLCEDKLRRGKLERVPDHFMPEHRLQLVDERILVRDGT